MVFAVRRSPRTLLPQKASANAAAEITSRSFLEVPTSGRLKTSLAAMVAAVMRQLSAEERMALAITRKKAAPAQSGSCCTSVESTASCGVSAGIQARASSPKAVMRQARTTMPAMPMVVPRRAEASSRALMTREKSIGQTM